MSPYESGCSGVRPPVLNHLDLRGVFTGAEGEIVDATRAGLHVPHRVLIEPDRVPFLESDDLVFDLDAGRSAHNDVDLLLPDVLVPERNSEAWREREEAQAERLSPSGVRANRACISPGIPNVGAWSSTSALRFFLVYGVIARFGTRM
jgi:hypothetical protein